MPPKRPEPRLDPPPDDPEGPCVVCGEDTTHVNFDYEFQCWPDCEHNL